MGNISVRRLLEVLARFDELGGASAGLVAWDLFAGEHAVKAAWDHALAEEWLKPAGRDLAYNEQLYRLTPAGWAAARERSPGLKAGPEAAEESV